MHPILEEIGKIGIVPVIKIDDVEKAVPLARALVAGGIPCAEVTFRTKEGEEAIRRIARELPQVLLGAGTITTQEQVDQAIAAGAKFIVSPGLNPKIVAYACKKGIPITPGCSNPSDIEAALEFGLDLVKFFPAEQAGGLDYIKAIAAPYTNVKFMPTGGINAGNITTYLAFEKIHACGGSWMVNAALLDAGDFDNITALCKEAVNTVLGFELKHIGINEAGDEAAARSAALLAKLFGFPVKDGSSSVFAGSHIEIMKQAGLGKHGHIAIGVNSVVRAMAHFERQGVQFNQETLRKDAKGKPFFIYFKDEISGFAIHLIQK
ncbi:MAG: bifunctional 4-hydroxy-2-oxoglutarate aldolase/2-dehydro-3-deoxy-phosphogluconate aldolase [Treponema sp.]|jgi:2-dehydro-3-deoxyphosphogluconate aldolase/(4S)-4-hydroxy-2-oxoglutarate aldolase|nr:bifunctional 4-hydroxy-2-oxoglutarate aldolase/2-dehydro-3-deoxy-phosphogluconate aldolase [Treponema sp.]